MSATAAGHPDSTTTGDPAPHRGDPRTTDHGTSDDGGRSPDPGTRSGSRFRLPATGYRPTGGTSDHEPRGGDTGRSMRKEAEDPAYLIEIAEICRTRFYQEQADYKEVNFPGGPPADAVHFGRICNEWSDMAENKERDGPDLAMRGYRGACLAAIIFCISGKSKTSAPSQRIAAHGEDFGTLNDIFAGCSWSISGEDGVRPSDPKAKLSLNGLMRYFAPQVREYLKNSDASQRRCSIRRHIGEKTFRKDFSSVATLAFLKAEYAVLDGETDAYIRMLNAYDSKMHARSLKDSTRKFIASAPRAIRFFDARGLSYTVDPKYTEEGALASAAAGTGGASTAVSAPAADAAAAKPTT